MDRARQPSTAVRGSKALSVVFGIRPNVGLRPTSPEKPAGIRIEPPPSEPVAKGNSPPATAAAVPPDEPPGVAVGSQGLVVVPWSLVDV